MNTALPISASEWKASYLALVTTLVHRRETQGITQNQLRSQLGISRRTLQRWEAGEVEPPAKRLFQWAACLGVGIASDVAQSGATKGPYLLRRPLLGLSAETISRVRQDILGILA